MANISASHDPGLPFPFPNLEAELPDGTWISVKTEVGAPAGKTKTILVDLANKLPLGARRLRWTTAFEIHLDSILLCERAIESSHPASITPDQTDLRWHGFGIFESLPDFLPLTPRYENPNPTPHWSRTVSGWCTRYGEVTDLLVERDDQMVLINGGDELMLYFKANNVPPKLNGLERSFFLFVVGWDKDADFHVFQGWQIPPLPVNGSPGDSPRRIPENGSHFSKSRQYNTRWVGSVIPRTAPK